MSESVMNNPNESDIMGNHNTYFGANLYTYHNVMITEFLRKHPEQDFYIEETSYMIQDRTFFDLVSHFSGMLAHSRVHGIDNYSFLIEGKHSGFHTIVHINVSNTTNYRSMKISKRSFSVTVLSVPSVVTDIFNWLDATFAGARIATIHWWYRLKDGISYTAIPLDEPFTVNSVAYPNITSEYPGVYEFFQEYLDSNCPLLFLSGPPGTGKTSFLRAMVWEHGLTASVTYDEEVLHRDDMFISFITGDTNLLILEDSESIVTSRERDKNEFMARFLNVSDGIIKTKNKKIIFTTNYSDFTDIDSALIREGRCFAFVNFRKLKWAEVIKVCEELKLPIPLMTGEYTIAQLYNQNKINSPGRKIGFK